MRNLDFSSWPGILSTLIGLVLVTAVVIGIRLVVMQTLQKRRERENRQINERLRTLIAAYKVLGGSFTGELAVDPAHLRDLRRRAVEAAETEGGSGELPESDRRRRIRDAVEAALSDVILLGTEEQVRLAANAAADLAAGRPTHTGELVVSLRNFIRGVLDLQPVPTDLAIPRQGPTRVAAGKSGKGDGERGGRQGGGGRGGGGGGGAGAGLGVGMGGGLALRGSGED